MAFQANDPIDPALLAMALSGRRSGGGLLGGSGMGSLLEPGPTPQMAWSGTLAQSPFYQGVPSQSGAFGQIAQAILPVVLANAASQQAAESEKNRQIFVNAHMEQAKAAIEQTRMELAAEAYNRLIMESPELQQRIAAGLPEGGKRTIKSKTGELDIVSPPKALPSVEEQMAGMAPAGVKDFSVRFDPKTRQLLVTGSTRKPPSALAGAMQKGLGDIAKAVLANGGTSEQAAEIAMRAAEYDAGTYVDLNDGQRKPVPDPSLVTKAHGTIQAYPTVERNLDELATAVKQSPALAAGGSSQALRIFQGFKDQLGGVGLGPLGDYIDKRTSELISEVDQIEGSPEFRAEMKAALGRGGRTGTGLLSGFDPNGAKINSLKYIIAYDLAKLKDGGGRLSDQDVQNWLNVLSGGDSSGVGALLMGARSMTEGIATVRDMARRERDNAQAMVDSAGMAGQWKAGRDLQLRRPFSAEGTLQAPLQESGNVGFTPKEPSPIEAVTAEIPTLAPGLVSPERYNLGDAAALLEKEISQRIIRSGGRPTMGIVRPLVVQGLKAAGYKPASRR